MSCDPDTIKLIVKGTVAIVTIICIAWIIVRS